MIYLQQFRTSSEDQTTFSSGDKTYQSTPTADVEKRPGFHGTLHSQVTKSPFWIPQGTSVVGLPSTLAAPSHGAGPALLGESFVRFSTPQTGTMSKESSQRSDVGRFSTIEDGVLVLKFFGLFGFDPYHS